MPIGDFNNTDSDDNSYSVIVPKAGKNIYFYISNLLNGSTKNMNVNGSVTPVYYTFAPSAGQIVYLDGLTVGFVDSGTPSLNKFGDLAALTNGVTIQKKVNGTSYDIANIKDNSDLIGIFYNQKGMPSAGAAFVNDSDSYFGYLKFPFPITLYGDSSDYIRIKINDNLTGITFFYSKVHAWRLV